MDIPVLLSAGILACLFFLLLSVFLFLDACIK